MSTGFHDEIVTCKLVMCMFLGKKIAVVYQKIVVVRDFHLCKLHLQDIIVSRLVIAKKKQKNTHHNNNNKR